ncbi:hypothetical protein BCR42DRAFT_349957 [Absidia repens]|uniref:DNA polymerase eta n=1 Tax=Absidia repens TaxID=90262 RepID=A0A1X2IJF9_9FUNG|nr:hypothetical protein BCR42DRAFT_349957 [Absidia repens]
MVKLPDCLKNSKCILHIDLDCFFCQVEEVRLGLDSSKPVAVQQWSSLIAVNYAARAAGISRHCSVDDAKKLCPEINLVHVATYAPNETTAQYHTNPSQATHKVSLDSYRNAGKKIFKIFNQHCNLLQKVGSDEAFLDVTEAVNERLCNEYIPAHPILLEHLDSDGDSTAILDDFAVDWTSLNHVVPSFEEMERQKQESIEADLDNPTIRDPTSWFDIQLAVGADIAAMIRKQVFDELHYTCSAGISHNKVLAKLGSSRNKPNKQTVIRQHIALQFMENIPFNKIRNLGGKFGQAVENEYKVENASDLWQYPLEELQEKFGASSGLWLYNIVRGIDHEEVILLKAPKSLMASKNIRPAISGQNELSPWYSVLSGELHARVMNNWKEYQSWPRTLSISYRTSTNYNTRSKSTPMLPRRDLENHEKLQRKVESLFNEVLDDLFPCVLLAVQASGLVPDASITNHTINNFFTTPAPNATHSADKDSGKNHTIGSSSSSSTPAIHTSPTSKPSALELFFANQSKRQQNEIEHSASSSTLSATAEKTRSSDTRYFFNDQKDKETEESVNCQSNDMIIPSKTATLSTWTCDQCHQRIPLEQVDEHTDYHFALDLDKEGEIHSIITNDDGKRKDRQELSTKNSAKRPKHLFFKPSSS